MIEIGTKIRKEFYTEAAILCNKAGDRHIEKINNEYIIVANVKPTLTIQEQVAALENRYNMPRVIREGILANESAYSAFNVEKAKEIELLAEQLRENGGNTL